MPIRRGGVGKTTSTVNLARAFVDAGKRVLLVDCDPQSSLSIVSGVDPRALRRLEDQGKTLYYGLVKDVPLVSLVIEGSPALIPASIRLANAETEIVSPFGVASILKEKLEPLRDQYDIILIDCPPTLSLLTVNALTAANTVVIPCKTDFLSIMGVPLLIKTIENVRRRANPGLTVTCILPTLYNARVTHDAEVLEELRNAESRAALELFPQTPGVDQYRQVAARILGGANG